MTIEIVNLANHHSLQKEAAKWFSDKWDIDEAIYLESIMKEGVIPNWFVAVEGDKIIAGAGVIENDFHNRPDLTPNICALYVEKTHRGQRLSEKLFNEIEMYLSSQGINKVYLITDHEGLYEKYSWSFETLVEEDETNEQIRLYGKEITD